MCWGAGLMAITSWQPLCRRLTSTIPSASPSRTNRVYEWSAHDPSLMVTTTWLRGLRRRCANDSHFHRGLELNSINAFPWLLGWAEGAAMLPQFCSHYGTGGNYR